ncbi:hypothetical protein WME75_04535 [Sorangium sp. So ce1014]
MSQPIAPHSIHAPNDFILAEHALVAAAWRDARAALERLERDGLLA